MTAVAGTGADLADMLLGYPPSGSGYIPTKLYEYADYYGAYFQDDIRLTKSSPSTSGSAGSGSTGCRKAKQPWWSASTRKTVNPLAASVTGILPRASIQFAGVKGNGIHVGNPNLNKFGSAYRHRLAA